MYYDEQLQMTVTTDGTALIDTSEALGYSICQGGGDAEPKQDD